MFERLQSWGDAHPRLKLACMLLVLSGVVVAMASDYNRHKKSDNFYSNFGVTGKVTRIVTVEVTNEKGETAYINTVGPVSLGDECALQPVKSDQGFLYLKFAGKL